MRYEVMKDPHEATPQPTAVAKKRILIRKPLPTPSPCEEEKEPGIMSDKNQAAFQSQAVLSLPMSKSQSSWPIRAMRRTDPESNIFAIAYRVASHVAYLLLGKTLSNIFLVNP